MDAANIGLLVAFGAGVLSFLSPCVLPLVPAYIGHLAGTSLLSAPEARRTTTLLHASAFVFGFSLVFVTFWASIGLIGYVLPGYVDIFRQLGGVVLIIMGLHQAGIWKIPFLYRQFRVEPQLGSRATPITSLLVGVAFAAGWTPCVGPILAGIIGLASMTETVGQGILLLIAYSMGLGLPFLATGLAISQATDMLKRMRRYMGAIALASGLLLIGIGLLMLSDSFKLLPQYFNWGAV